MIQFVIKLLNMLNKFLQPYSYFINGLGFSIWLFVKLSFISFQYWLLILSCIL